MHAKIIIETVLRMRAATYDLTNYCTTKISDSYASGMGNIDTLYTIIAKQEYQDYHDYWCQIGYIFN